MKFALITYILHKRHNDKFYSYEPYVREMNIWLKEVGNLILVAPAVVKSPDPIEISYKFNRINFKNIPQISLLSLRKIFCSVLNFPLISFRIFKAMKQADHIHLRCPGNIGLIACLVQMLFPNKPKTVKYAGNWDPQAKQPWSYRLQKKILSNTVLSRNIKVLVYGQWPDQTKNILPFFTASFSETNIENFDKDFTRPYNFLFVGSLVVGKQPLFAVELVEALNKKNINAKLHVYGDGVLRDALNEVAGDKAYIQFYGNQPLDVLKEAYMESHFLVLASKSEGWPKAVAEAMFFGCIPIATEVSCVPWMLNYGSRGILIPGKEYRTEKREKRNKVESGLLDTFQKNRQFECFLKTAEAVSENVSRTGFSETLEVTSGTNNESKDALEETVQKIIELIQNAEQMKRMSEEAQEWSQQYTLEKFEAEIKKLLISKDNRP